MPGICFVILRVCMPRPERFTYERVYTIRLHITMSRCVYVYNLSSMCRVICFIVLPELDKHYISYITLRGTQ